MKKSLKRLYPLGSREFSNVSDLLRALTATKVGFSGEPDCAELLQDLDALIKKWRAKAK
jgi:hypothetical protein